VPGSDYRALQNPVLELQWLLGKKALEAPRSFLTRHELKLRLPPSPPDGTVRDEDRVGGGWGAPLNLIERMRERPKKWTGSGH
jgi:hypothetical protein